MTRTHGYCCILAATAIASGLACTKKNELFADAAIEFDAASVIDAQSAPDAQTHGQVTVHVFVSDEPTEGIAVLAHAPNGDYITSGVSDANGEVIFPNFPAGGAVTAAVNPFRYDLTHPSANHLSTIQGVAIGETITFGRSRRRPLDGNGVTLAGATDVTLAGDFAGATRYHIAGPCASGGGLTSVPDSVSMYEECFPSGGLLDIVSYAVDTSGNIAYASAKGIGTTGGVPDVAASTVLPAWQTDMGIYQMQVVDSPQDELLFVGTYLGLNKGLPYVMRDPGERVLQEGDDDSVAIKVAPNFYDESVFAVVAGHGDGAQSSLSYVALREDGAPAANATIQKSLNLTTEVPGLISNVEASESKPIVVTWNAGSLACKDNLEPDALVVVVSGTTESDETYRWLVLSPGNTPSGISLPAIDPVLAETLWPEESFTERKAGVVFKSDSSQTYDDMRSKTYNLSSGDWVPPRSNSVQCLALAGHSP